MRQCANIQQFAEVDCPPPLEILWYLPRGPVGLPARWAATSNVEGGSGGMEKWAYGREGSTRINY